MINILTPEQVENWRRVIYFRLESVNPGAGSYALIMSVSEIQAFYERTKAILETQMPIKNEAHSTNGYKKKVCDHSNSFTGSRGKYCIDCEKYV